VTRRRDGRRRDERGHAAIIVAVSSTVLLGMTGLALDGGMEAGAYRKAQTAADAGALAAVRTAYTDATAVPPVVPTVSGLTAVATKEIQHNSAQLAAFNGTVGASTGSTPVYGPATSGGLTGQSALADMWASAGPILGLADTNLDLVQTQATAKYVSTGSGGSVASSQVDLSQTTATGISANSNCYTARATWVNNTNTYGVPSACTTGTQQVNVSVGGTLLGGAATNDEVDINDWPIATPNVQGTSVLGNDGLSGTGVSLSATSAASGNDLYWNGSNGITADGEVTASSVSGSVAGYAVSSASLGMWVSISVNPWTGTPSINYACTPTTLSVAGTSVPITSACAASSPPPVIPGVTITINYAQPGLTPATACTTSSGTITCTLTSCLMRVDVHETPWDSILCLAEINLGFSVVPMTLPSFISSVSDAATVPQPTYFMRVLGWSQTNPTAQASADVESIIDEPQSSFASSPFAMPDTATNMTSPYHYEPLTPGHTYYLDGINMQSYNPAAVMPSGWQGQLTTGSPHREGSQLTSSNGVSGTPTTTPQPFDSHGNFYLEPVFNPVSGVIEAYAVFLPVSGHSNWGLLVNSLPPDGGYLVQATSISGWVPFETGAVAVKLEG
jgi:hypothetical protein